MERMIGERGTKLLPRETGMVKQKSQVQAKQSKAKQREIKDAAAWPLKSPQQGVSCGYA